MKKILSIVCVFVIFCGQNAVAGEADQYRSSKLRRVKTTGTSKYDEQNDDTCKQIPDIKKFDCGPGATQKDCQARGCCWQPTNMAGAPYCFYPAGYNSFKFVNMTQTEHGAQVIYERGRPSGYPGDFMQAVAEFVYLSEDILQVKIYDPNQSRFEPPIPEIPGVPAPISKLNYRVQVGSESAGFKIIRSSDNVTIVNTLDAGALILSDKFLQISTLLPTNRVFGLGENRDRFRKDINWKTITLYNNDSPPSPLTSLYGTHPFYLAVEKDGKSHGMLLLNSNALDVAMQPTPALTFRAVGGVLNLFFFVGPSPQEVLAQYTSIIGRPFLPPYWSLGFHLCKYGYNDLNTTRHVWKSNRDAGIPFDVQWNDIDYMINQNDFTYDPVRFHGLPDFVKELHSVGMHYVMIIDPGVSAAEKPGTYPPYERGLQMDIFVKNSSDLPFTGRVWNPVGTVWPDFTHPNATDYWTEMMADYYKHVEYDGAWIDMNEPSNLLEEGQIFGPCAPLKLPYTPIWARSSTLNRKTVCMEAKHHIGVHYDVHNLYSLYEAVATNFALQEIRGKRPFIISRSSFPGLGRYSGHWSGDISSTWDDMRYSISDLLSFSLFGIPMMGADICGFGGQATPELCKRWMQLGAFYPFSRNHADVNSKPQDPVSMGPEVVEASKAALRLRYQLLPYYYTLFWRAHVNGNTVATPVLFLSPENELLDSIDDQFLIGHHVMIAPILDPQVNVTKAFYPGANKWYNIVDGRFIASGGYASITDQQMVAVQGGAILPLQNPTQGPITTSNTRSRPLQLLVVPDNTVSAAGELYWDDGDSLDSYSDQKYSHIKFELNGKVLSSKVSLWGYEAPHINNITVLAQNRPVKSVAVDGVAVYFKYNENSKILYVDNLNISLKEPFTVTWKY